MGSKAFKNLQAKWYRKLKDTGFEDIEQDEENLKDSSTKFSIASRCYSGNKATIAYEFKEKEKYYQRASELLKEDSFLDVAEKRIWDLHARGFPIRKIVQVLKTEGIDRNKNQVNQVINELQGLMFEATP